MAEISDARRDADTSKAGAVLESAKTDGGNGPWERDARQAGAMAESATTTIAGPRPGVTDGGDA